MRQEGLKGFMSNSQHTASSATLITIQHVTKRYRAVQALSDFSLQIPRGSIFGLIGPNGAGKTTLIRILAALLVPDSGQVWIDSEEISEASSLIQRSVGYMPDFFGVYPDLTAAEYLQFYAGIHKVPRQKQAGTVSDLLELVDLTSKRDALVETLSRGMKQRLCLARALVHDPQILLLDEPASGLDPRARVELRELLRSLQSMGKTVIISSHILLELAEMCTDVAIIQAGRLIASGDVKSISHRLTGRQLEIRLLEAEHIPSALSLLTTLPDISNATHDEGNLIVADFSGDDQALTHIIAELISKGVSVVSFAPRSAGNRLEEVFMSVTEGSN